MEIGIDATSWQNTRGYGRHIRALFSTLVRLDRDNRYTFFMDSVEQSEVVPETAEVKIIETDTPTATAAAAEGHRSMRDMWRVSRAMSNRNFDLLMFPTVYSYVPVFSRAKKLVMIHDVIADTYPELTLPTWRAQIFWKAKVAIGRRQADTIVTVSEYSRQEIAKRFQISPECIFVVGEASAPIFRKLDDALPSPTLVSMGLGGTGRYLIYVGGFGPHKNLEMLVNTLGKIATQTTFADVRLVMVGEYKKEVFHSYYNTLQDHIAKLGIQDSVVFTGYLSDEDLVILLNLSAALVLPSLMEGFGLPAVEAAACGCPVVATTASPLPQLLGEGGLYVDPRMPEELESTLTRILTSEKLRHRMSAAGLAAAKSLTWDAAAQQMIDVIHKTVAR